MAEEMTETILSNTENIKSVFTIVESIENLKKKLYDGLLIQYDVAFPFLEEQEKCHIPY
jgi:hypothetical protein